MKDGRNALISLARAAGVPVPGDYVPRESAGLVGVAGGSSHAG